MSLEGPIDLRTLLRATLPTLLLGSALCAQTPGLRIPTNATTLTLGVGGGPIGLAAGAELTHRRGMSDVTVRGLATAQLVVFAGETRSLGELGLLYGIHPFANRNALAAKIGVAAVRYSVTAMGSAPRHDYGPTLGVPWEVSVVAPFSDIMGVGVSVVGNMNSLRHYTVVLLTLHLGRLRLDAT